MKTPLEKKSSSYLLEKLKQYGKQITFIAVLSGGYYWYFSSRLSNPIPLLASHEKLINSCFQNKGAEKCMLLNNAFMALMRDDKATLESVYSPLKDKVTFEEISEYCKNIEEIRHYWKTEKQKIMAPFNALPPIALMLAAEEIFKSAGKDLKHLIDNPEN